MWRCSGRRERPDDAADIDITRRYLDDVDRLLENQPIPIEFFEAMAVLHRERINPGVLWVGAQTLLAGTAAQ
jgi:hypothetical protein